MTIGELLKMCADKLLIVINHIQNKKKIVYIIYVNTYIM